MLPVRLVLLVRLVVVIVLLIYPFHTSDSGQFDDSPCASPTQTLHRAPNSSELVTRPPANPIGLLDLPLETPSTDLSPLHPPKAHR